MELLRIKPTDVANHCRRVLENIDQAHRERVSVVLGWAVFAAQPLTVRELSSIVDSQCRDCPNPPLEEIVGMTKGMLVTRNHRSENTQSVTYVIAPETAEIRRFLLSKDARGFRMNHADTHKNMLDVCLEVLLEHGESQSQRVGQGPLVQYAANSWLKHLTEARKGRLCEGSFEKTIGYIRRLFDSAAPNAFLCWLRLHDPAEPELGTQPAKRLEEFRPMEFYTDKFKLQVFLADGPRNAVDAEHQGDIHGSHLLQPAIREPRQNPEEQYGQENRTGRQGLKPAMAEHQTSQREEDLEGDRTASSIHRASRLRILSCRPH